ncbi:hypothetical protein Tco_0220977 [Tanacetum coccineum]
MLLQISLLSGTVIFFYLNKQIRFLLYEVDPTYQDPEGDILLLEAILNSEPPPHLEYAFLEGDDKLPVIIAKDLKDDEKAALLKVLKSHKRAIAWKLSDIKGVSPECLT